MCVQLAGTEDLDAVAIRFAARPTMTVDGIHEKSKNAARIRPTDRAPAIITAAGERRLGWMRWGWQEQLAATTKPQLLLHARFETAISKPLWAEAFAHRRCVIVTQGWWEVVPQPGRQRGLPYFYQSAASPLLALAALWRREVNDIRFTMLTTEPTSELAPIHDRMPVVLSDEHIVPWLNGAIAPQALCDFGQSPGAPITAWQTTALGEQTRV